MFEEDPPAGGTGGEPANAEDRTSAALEALTADAPKETPAAPAPKPGEEPAKPGEPKLGEAAGVPKPGEEPAKPGEPKPGEPAPADDITKAAFFADPAFQKFYTAAQADNAVMTEFRKVFDAGRYKIENAKALEGVHEDAFLLYDIADGKVPADKLLEVFKANWTEERFKAVVQELANYAARMDVAGNKEAPNPLDARVSAIERQNQEATQRAEAEATIKRNMENVVIPLETEIKRLLTEKGIAVDPKAPAQEQKEAQAEIDDYLDFVSAELGKSPELLKQIEKKQYGEARRIFTQRYNQLVQRAKRYADGKIKQFEERKAPRQPGAGGASDRKPAAPAFTDAGDVRRAKAAEMLKG